MLLKVKATRNRCDHNRNFDYGETVPVDNWEDLNFLVAMMLDTLGANTLTAYQLGALMALGSDDTRYRAEYIDDDGDCWHLELWTSFPTNAPKAP